MLTFGVPAGMISFMGTEKRGRDEDWDLPELAGWKHEPDEDEVENDDEHVVGGPLIGDILGPATRDIDWERFDALDRMFTAMGNEPPARMLPEQRDAALKAVLAELTAAAAAVGNTSETAHVPTGKPIRLRLEELWNQR